MGTSMFAVPTLVRLFEEAFPIVGVITQPDKPSGRGQAMQAPPIKRTAYELHLPIYQPVTLKDEAARSLFQTLRPDLIVVVAYGKILPPWLLQLAPLGAINLHGSLLPKYRGAAPIHWAVANGETETGVCTMQLDEGLDTGPVYLCEKTAIGAEESVSALSDRLAGIGKNLVVQTVRGIAEGTLAAKPQNTAEATYAPIIKKIHGFIDWNDSAVTIHNRIRAFNPWPGATTMFRGSVCKILRSRTVGHEPTARGDAGSIVVEKRVLFVLCGDGNLLEIIELQPENRKPVAGFDFANGARIRPGEKFELMSDNGSRRLA
jgi:methionyl-tRNA formyltransferase